MEQTDANTSVSLSTDSNVRTVSIGTLETQEVAQKEERMNFEAPEKNPAKNQETVPPTENALNSKENEDMDNDHVPAVTPPSVEGGVQPQAATLEETVATDVESPIPENPTITEALAAGAPTESIQTETKETITNTVTDGAIVGDGESMPGQNQETQETSGDQPMTTSVNAHAPTADSEDSIVVGANDEGSQSSGGSQLVDTDTEIMLDYAPAEDEDMAVVEAVAAQPSLSAAPAPASTEVIDLLDSDDEDDGPPAAKRPRMDQGAPSVAAASFVAHTADQAVALRQQQQLDEAQRIPVYIDPVPGFTPTWKNLLPNSTPVARAPQHQAQQNRQWKYYELSLLNVSEFTITGLRVGDEYSGYMTSVAGLRSHIKKISKGHGNAFFERDPDGGTGKWHIPLGAYHAFFGWLRSLPYHRVDGISDAQLKIASLGKARLEKDYPSARKLMKLGVPTQLASALAPFQRGGVDFVIDKGGRSLIADEMGLGKTIQGIASMSVYHEEWPLLVLCPSSARYHWENEFRHWLGKSSSINDGKHVGAFDVERKEDGSEGEEDDGIEPRPSMPLLEDSQIHVLTSGQDPIFPRETTKVVICSYGLAPNLVANERLLPGMFKCAIVDESHMLKNKSTQRTKKLLPLLQATDRCVLLSGTPAFARPLELWPQLQVLGTEQHGWGADEKEYIKKYSRGGTQRRAELHTLLMGTVMIRRMKNDILKTLPPKEREQGIVDVMDSRTRTEMKECMVTLRTGKGKLCQLARDHNDDVAEQGEAPQVVGDDSNDTSGTTNGVHGSNNAQQRSEVAAAQMAAATDQLRQEIEQRRAQGYADIQRSLMYAHQPLDPVTVQAFRRQLESRLEDQLQTYYQAQLRAITTNIAAGAASLPLAAAGPPQPEPASAKKTVLNYMYSLTGKCKIPIVVEMLKKWLADPSRGKLCIFAHHISCLNDIVAGAGLSNASGSTTKYIRIDGSTTPKARQEQINRFQRDSSVRIAILGITAAGVAVTLTASSTVWFAELFWTPAIMIQAEDRVHRIGQQAVVKCLYFVAKGTLDELLWKLLESKFQDLGEFVEGKEKMKMVVNKKYHSSHELLRTVAVSDEDDMSDGDSECSLEHVEEQLGSDIEHEIEELGLSEQKLLDAVMDNEGSDPESQSDLDSKPAAKATKKDARGTTEDEAICLSDDDDDAEAAPAAPAAGRTPEESTAESTQAATATNPTAQEVVAKKPPAFNFNTASFPRLRLYRLLFAGPRFGLVFSLVEGRMVVAERSEERKQKFGPGAKPHVGDVLVAINRQSVPITTNLKHITKYLEMLKARGSVELLFAEDSDITHYSKEEITRLDEEREARAAQEQQAALVAQQVVDAAAIEAQNGATTAQAPAQDPNEVIEID